ncbi:hypothetical protein [Noviherbaspirillum soli]|uniref:hypothetical protein n=1 Tax=Noviherbaspirillum soli TaxID=1064518 RepID=UPI00188C77B1|nr:hypothetical protein [Noviherbaspirillum soli]
MPTAILKSEFPDSSAVASQPELLVSAALHLMSHYSTQAREGGPCLKLASVIERHLKALAALAALPQLAPVLQGTCSQLAEQWAMHIEQAAPSARPTLLTRMLNGARA